jgi:ligand-binding SRPBCC domain-containing protein
MLVELETEIDAPRELCFDLSLDIDLHQRSMANSGERAIAGVTSGRIGLNQTVTWQARHFGIRWRMTSKITFLERPHRFVDEMVSGPFNAYRHEHLFQERGKGTLMVDRVEMRSPGGPLHGIPDLFVGPYLRRLLAGRNDESKRAAERTA